MDQKHEKRSGSRHHIESALPICIRVEGAERPCFARLFNVSDFGLGLIISERLSIDKLVTVITLKSKMTFKIAWIEANKQEHNTYLCGLEPLGSQEEFSTAYSSFITNNKAS